MGLSICVASSGRPTLTRTLESIASQMAAGDELLVDMNADGDWGNAARNRMMAKATGDFIMFMDDDDVYTDDALATVRETAVPDRVNLYRMRYQSGIVLWCQPKVECANVSTQMVVVPKLAVRWGERYEADYDFIAQCCAELGEPVWHDVVIALIRPS